MIIWNKNGHQRRKGEISTLNDPRVAEIVPSSKFLSHCCVGQSVRDIVKLRVVFLHYCPSSTVRECDSFYLCWYAVLSMPTCQNATRNAGSQYCYGWVGRGVQPPSKMLKRSFSHFLTRVHGPMDQLINGTMWNRRRDQQTDRQSLL